MRGCLGNSASEAVVIVCRRRDVCWLSESGLSQCGSSGLGGIVIGLVGFSACLPVRVCLPLAPVSARSSATSFPGLFEWPATFCVESLSLCLAAAYSFWSVRIM